MLWRIVALVLLLGAAGDLLAVDTFGLLGDPSEVCSDSECHDCCYCCCRHLIVIHSVVLQPLVHVDGFVTEPVSRLESISVPTPYHPPRA